MKQFILVVRGPSGSGKSSISKMIQEKIGKRVALLKADYFYWKVCPQDENKHLDENPIVYKNLLDLAENYLESGYSVIIEGLLNKVDDYQFDTRLQELSDKTNVVYKRIYLQVDLATAKVRHSSSDFSIPIEEVEGWAKGREMQITNRDLIIDTVGQDQNFILNKIMDIINKL